MEGGVLNIGFQLINWAENGASELDRIAAGLR